MATTVSHRLPPTQAHAIADLTGYEDADTLRWQQACVQAAQHLTAERGRYAGTDPDRLAQGLDLAQRGGVTLAEDLDDLRAEVTSGNAHYTVDLAQLGCLCLDFQQRKAPCTHLLAAEIHTGALGLFTASAPLRPPDTAPPATNTSLQEAPGTEAPEGSTRTPFKELETTWPDTRMETDRNRTVILYQDLTRNLFSFEQTSLKTRITKPTLYGARRTCAANADWQRNC